MVDSNKVWYCKQCESNQGIKEVYRRRGLLDLEEPDT